MSLKRFWAHWLFAAKFLRGCRDVKGTYFLQIMWKRWLGKGERKGLGSVPSLSQPKGKNLRWPQLEFHMRTLACGRDVHVLWSRSKDWALLLAERGTRGWRQVSLGKHALLALGETTCPGWSGMMRSRKLGPDSDAEQCSETVKLRRIPCACCWVSSKYSSCYHYIWYTHLTPKYLFSESILSVCLWQSAGSYLLYSWFKLKLLRIMGQLSITSHPPP